MLLRRQVTDTPEDQIDFTPMVDVVFQLMTFMLFSLQVTGGEEVNVPPAKHGVGVEKDAATFLSLLPAAKAGGEAKAVIGLGNGPAATPEQVKRAVAEGVREGRKKVVLQADGAIPHGEVLRWAATVTEVEGVTLHIGVQEAK
jgi:biopolymer transport protein ExbD